MAPLTVKQLGRKGRFANQLLQYAMLRQRARDAGADYCCPAWVGQELFGLKDPPPVKGAVDIGYKFPLDAAWYDKELFRGLFRPQEEFTHTTLDYFRGTNNTVIGLHLRRGDYGTFQRKSARWAFVAPTAWYVAWLKENWSRFHEPVLFIASDDAVAVKGDFGGYPAFWYPTPSSRHDAVVYADFYVLTQCDVLLISNSTFGYAASMLNERATEFWRPRLGEKKLIPYEPWQGPLIFTDEKY